MAPAMAPDTAFRVTIGLDVGLDVDGDGGTAPRPGLSDGGRSRMTAAAKLCLPDLRSALILIPLMDEMPALKFPATRWMSSGIMAASCQGAGRVV